MLQIKYIMVLKKKKESFYLSAGVVSDQWFHFTAEDVHLTIFPFLSFAIRSQLPNKPTEAVEQQAALQINYVITMNFYF
jgi:hypothetical protein